MPNYQSLKLDPEYTHMCMHTHSHEKHNYAGLQTS